MSAVESISTATHDQLASELITTLEFADRCPKTAAAVFQRLVDTVHKLGYRPAFYADGSKISVRFTPMNERL